MATSRASRFTFMTRLTLTFVVIVTLGGCPVERGYVLYDNHCLKLYQLKKNYQTAIIRCDGDGAHLMDFKSREADGPALQYLLDTMGQVIEGNNETLWVGANDIEVEGRFLWSDGTILTKDSRLWASGQPDDWKKSEDCVEVSFSSVFNLNDRNCSSILGFVCQVDLNDK